MNPTLVAAVTLAVLGLLFFLLAVRARSARGLSSGETEALDNVTLTSLHHGLVGRPDRIVKTGKLYIPEEWKSAKRVSRGHQLQLGTYFILIEEKYGVRPPHGVLVLGDGKRVTVPNTEHLRAEVLAVAAMIRERRARLREPIPVTQPANKCRKCGQRDNCGQASG